MPGPERKAQQRLTPGHPRVSMSDLLASCAAAYAVSTPPCPPVPAAPTRPGDAAGPPAAAREGARREAA